jgi:phosphonatase-like hydrolase
MDIRLVVFDMAGTTVYDGDAVHRAFAGALQAAGIPVTRDEINEVMGLPKPEAIRLLLERKLKDTGQHGPERIAVIHNDFVGRMIRFYESDPSVREADGAADTFRRLRRAGIKVALDTGFSRAITDVIVQRLGWAQHGLVDASVTSDEVERGRPHPDMILRAMQLTGITDAKRTAKVGDTPSDLQEGMAAGCAMVIGVTTGSHTRQQLEACPHTHLIEGVSALPALLQLADR